MKVVVYTLGCKVNTVESRSIMHDLTQCGAEVSDSLEKADAYILNTCSVTSEADRKCRQMIGKFFKLNAHAKIYITGCSSQRDPAAYEKYSNVIYIGGNADKYSIVNIVMSGITPDNKVNICKFSSIFDDFTIPQHTKTRDYIKVQDGCNNFCSYCVIPHVRGRERSRDIESIVCEANIAALSCKEIVLTGINVSAYGKDIGLSLAELFLSLKNVAVRKRLSSLECNVVDETLLDAMAESGFCDHFHLSLQSGCDKVLKDMNRHYNTDCYLKKVELIRKYYKNAGITTDIITGFPCESDEDFEETISFVRRIGFSDIHIFPFSERRGTKAAEMKQVPMDVRRLRAARLGAVRDELKNQFLEKQIGKTLSVYVEADGQGYSTNYVKVYTGHEEGIIADVKIKKLYGKGVK